MEELKVGQGWKAVDSFPIALSNGDQLGARAYADGTVEVYANCELVGIANTITVAGTFMSTKAGGSACG